MKRAPAHLPTGSTADIAFLLLIFFLTVSTLNSDKGIGLLLPASDAVSSGKKPQLEILIDADHSLWVHDRSVTRKELIDLVRREIAGDPDRNVCVIASRRAAYGDYIAALDAVRIAGARHVSTANP